MAKKIEKNRKPKITEHYLNYLHQAKSTNSTNANIKHSCSTNSTTKPNNYDTVNPLINAPFFLTPPSNKRPPKNQNYFINASLF